jgi:hypothetical protein
VDILVNGAAGNFLAEAKNLSPKGFKTVRFWLVMLTTIIKLDMQCLHWSDLTDELISLGHGDWCVRYL